MAEDQMLEQWARWLGVYDQSVVKKSLELRRLLDLKLKADISATTRTVLCLDIAATLLGTAFDADEALKRLKLRSNDYLRQRRTVEKLLGMAKQITIAELCVQLDLQRGVQQAAARMFAVYRERAQIDDQSDFTHPQYAAMSVYQCCKAMRVRVSRATLLRASHLRGAQWTLLERDWCKCMGPAEGLVARMQEIEAREAAAERRRREESGVDGDGTNERMASAADQATDAVVKTRKAVVQESYEAWRERILAKAYAELAAQEAEEELQEGLEEAEATSGSEVMVS